MTTLTPDEVETGRRDMIAKLRYEYADGRIPEITLDADMIRDLVALLEALKPVVVDRAAVRDAVSYWLPSGETVSYVDDATSAVLAALYPKATEGKS